MQSQRGFTQFFVLVNANKREEGARGSIQAGAEAVGQAVGEVRQGQEQLPHGLQEREVRRQPGEERDERLESVSRRGKMCSQLFVCKYGPLIFYT